MGEVPFGNYEHTPDTMLMEGMFDELSMQRKRWEKTGEPVMAAQCEALLYAALLDPAVATVIGDAYEFRKRRNPDISYSEIIGVFRTTLIMDQIELGQKPHEWTCRTQWVEPIREVAHLVMDNTPPPELQQRADRLSINLMSDKVGTTPFTRANAEELFMQSVAPYRPDGFRVLDIGSGMMQSLLQILCKHKYGFEPVALYSAPTKSTNFNTWQPRADLTTKANDLLQRPHRITEATATDLINPYISVHGAQWSKASLRVSQEQNNPRFMSKYNGLAAERPAELTFQEVDFTSRDDVERFKSSIGDIRFDIIIISALQHQLRPEERKIMDNCALSVASEDGFIIKQDFFSVSPRNPRRQNFYKHWHLPGRFRFAVYQPDHPKRGWQELFAGDDSRMRRMFTSWGSVAINGSFSTSEELILAA